MHRLSRANVSSLRARAVGRRSPQSLLTRPSSTTTSDPKVDASVPPTPKKPSKYQRFLTILGRTTLVTLLVGTGTFIYTTQKDRHPGSQLPFDPTKKTVVVLGSGWGATGFLRGVDTAAYNIVLISPKNFFLFTPLLPSVAVGTLSPRAIIQPTRYVARHKERVVTVIEAEAQSVDPVQKTVTFTDDSEIKGALNSTTIPYDYLVMAVGAEVQTFGIPGVKEKACFMKELADAEKMQRRFMDCIESAAFPGQSPEEIDRLLHMVVVGGGPTGIELSGEIHDFLEDDLKAWYPELASKIRITLVEALPSVLPMFSKQLIEYTESTFKESKIDILTKTMVKEVKDQSVVLQMPDKTIKDVPCGMVVWAAGNKGRKVSMDLMGKAPSTQTVRRGISVDENLRMLGFEDSIFAIGDCTATSYAPTAQVAGQQGTYVAKYLSTLARKEALSEQLALAVTAAPSSDATAPQAVNPEVDSITRQLAKLKFRPFHYSHQGTLAYIGSEKAIADLPFMNGNFASGGVATYLFWRSAYVSNLFSLRNRVLVVNDWLLTKIFGRDVSRDS